MGQMVLMILMVLTLFVYVLRNTIDNMMEKRLYKLADAAIYMGIPKGSLYKMAWQKRLPFVVKDGRLLRFDKQGMDNWIEEHTQQVRP